MTCVEVTGKVRHSMKCLKLVENYKHTIHMTFINDSTLRIESKVVAFEDEVQSPWIRNVESERNCHYSNIFYIKIYYNRGKES